MALLYSPVAGLVWLGGGGPGLAAAVAAVLALGVEAARLFVPGTHPDPTNLGIAAVSAAAAAAVLQHLVAHGVKAAPGASAPVPHPATGPGSAAAAAATGVVLGPALLLWVVAAPWQPWALGLGLLALGLLVRRRPAVALVLGPAAWTVADSTFWSGRRFLDEFDAATAVMAWAVLAARPGRVVVAWRALPGTVRGGLLAVGVALLAAALQGSGVWGRAAPGELALYAGPWAPWWVFKGLLLALTWAAVWAALAPAPEQPDARPAALAAGTALALALLLAVVVWERGVFTGVLDATRDYRITGPFSAMHKGGATIECALALLAAFALQTALDARWRRPWRVGAALLVAGAVYGVWVTYSRGGYAALVVAVLGVTWVSARQAAATGVPGASGAVAALRDWALPLAAASLLLAAGGALVLQGQARERLARSAEDLRVRLDHWSDAMALRRDDAVTAVLGEGLARFPDAHLWRSAEPVRAARFGLVREDPRPALRLAAGAPLYVEQVIPRPAVPALVLRLQARAVAGGPPHPAVVLCDKWTLTSRTCVSAGPWRALPPSAAPAASAPAAETPEAAPWQIWEATLNASPLLAVSPARQAVLKLALQTPEHSAVEVRGLALTTALGDELLANGDFRGGLERWFWSTDRDPPWLIHNLALHLWFEQGGLGVLAWSALLGVAVVRGARLAAQGRAAVPAAWPALLAVLACGLLNTLVDEPRVLAALLLLALAAAGERPESGDSVPQP